MTEPSKKPKCPECGVELEGEPETCAKCGFEITGYKTFYRLLKAGMSQMKAEQEAAEAEAAAKRKTEKPSAMDLILGKKKAKA